MKRLLYISESAIEKSEEEATLSHIVAGAQIRNARLSLTGSLLFTNKYFAQILEGPSASVEGLMASISDDRRHVNIVVVHQCPISERTFPDWKMAYHGPSQFVNRHVSRLLHQTSYSEKQRATKWLTELAREFSST